ncbi:hypothetical protein AB3504_19665, partial [Acinetobacter baumannii]
NAVAIEKFERFEWLTHGLTASSPSIEPVVRGTGEKPLNYQDRLGAIASMDTQLAKWSYYGFPKTNTSKLIERWAFLLLCPTSLEHWIPMCWTGFLVDA